MSISLLAEPATVVCESALEFEYRDGLFYVTDPTLGVRKLMRPAVMQQTIAAAAVCYREFRTEQGAQVIQFPERRARTANSPG